MLAGSDPRWSFAVGAVIVVAVVALSVVYAAKSNPQTGKLTIDTQAECDQLRAQEWDRFEVGHNARTVKAIYYGSGSIRPCGVSFDDGILGVFTDDPGGGYTLDLAPHCVRFFLSPEQAPPGVLRDAASGAVHGISLGLYDEYGSGGEDLCVLVGMVD